MRRAKKEGHIPGAYAKAVRGVGASKKSTRPSPGLVADLTMAEMLCNQKQSESNIWTLPQVRFKQIARA
jgi:hypothetical protein